MDMTDKSLKTLSPEHALAAWSGIAEPGDTRIGALVERYGPEEALQWAAKPFREPRVEETAGPPWRLVHERIRLRLQNLDLERELNALTALGGTLLTKDEPAWPEALDALGPAAPFALWVLGRPPEPSQSCVALVGARASTAYGNAVATNLAFELSSAGICTVSGGAYGIDSAAHRGALKGFRPVEGAKALPTVAVLCGGLGNLYPAGNTSLFSQIVANGGGLLAEMPPSYRPARWRFLERNRIIAALSEVTIVAEAGVRSGAIASANRAVELGREVGAIPGPVTSATSSGANQLLKDGAHVITETSDVTALLGQVDQHESGSLFDLPEQVRTWQSQNPSKLDVVDPLERRAWDALPRRGSASLEQAATESGLSIGEVRMGLLGLEAQGLATVSDTGHWGRVA